MHLKQCRMLYAFRSKSNLLKITLSNLRFTQKVYVCPLSDTAKSVVPNVVEGILHHLKEEAA